jgi:hypothetical protein
MYQVLKDIHESKRVSNTKDANNLALNIMKEILIKRHELVALPDKPNIKVLDRESVLYGNRSVNDVQIKPEFTAKPIQGHTTVF